MPRKPSARTPYLKSYSVFLTVAEEALAARLAELLGTLNDRGEPSRSALFNHLVREEYRRRAQRAAKPLR